MLIATNRAMEHTKGAMAVFVNADTLHLRPPIRQLAEKEGYFFYCRSILARSSSAYGGHRPP